MFRTSSGHALPSKLVRFALSALLFAPLAAPGATRSLSLADMGFGRGVVLQGQAGEATFYFPVPADTKINAANVNVRYAASSLLGKHSNLRVMVNGVPRQAVSLHRESGAPIEANVLVPLSAEDLRKTFVEVAVRANFLVTDDHCIDERAHAGFVSVLPTSNLSFDTEGTPATIRGFVDALPRTISIATERAAGEGAMLAAWRVGHAMQRSGRTVQFVDELAKADIVLATRAALSTVSSDKLDESAVAVVGIGQRRALAVTEPFNTDAITSHWLPLLLDTRAVQSTFKEVDPTTAIVPLSSFGLRQGLREVTTSAEWAFQLVDADLPPRKAPKSLHLDLVAAELPTGRPWNLFVYLNDVLAYTQRVSGGPQPVGLDVPLPRNELTGRYAIRIGVSRHGEEGECRRHVQPLPIQILPSSRLSLQDGTGTVERFSQVSGLMRTGVTVHLPRDLDSPALILERLMVLSQTFNISPRRASFATDAQLPGSGRGFIWLGTQAPGNMKGPIDFDSGRIVVRDASGERVVDTSGSTRLSVMQLVGEGGTRGVWWRSLDGKSLPVTPTRNLDLNEGDVAFVSLQRTELELSSKESRLASVLYPEQSDWRVWLANHRYWLFGLGWVVATILFVLLFRRARHGR